MLLNFLKRYAPILMFLVVLGLCAGLVSLYYIDPKSEDAVKTVAKDKKTIEDKLSAGVVTPEYPASAEQAAKIRFVESLKADIDRNKRTTDEPIGINTSYPQPVRVKSEAKPIEPDAIPIFGILPSLKESDYEVTADRGKVYVKLELPKPEEFKMTEPVRIEIYRGLAKNKINLTNPWGTIELGLEDPPAVKPGAAQAAPVSPPAAAPVENTRRANAAAGRDPKDKPKPVFVLPATLRVYRDTTDIQQVTEYFYQARLVARYTGKEGMLVAEKQPDGKSVMYIHKLPNDPSLIPVKPANPASSAKLYATPLTPVKSAKTPTNFTVRFSGINGQVPPIGFLRPPNAHNNTSFSANFEIGAWIADLGKWQTHQIQEVREGEMLSGKIVYNKDGEKKEYDFTKDLGYKLFEVNMQEVESSIKGQKEVKEVALLENQKTKAMEPFLKEPKRPGPVEKLNMYDKVVEAQEKEMEKIRKAAALPAALAPAPAPAPVPAAPALPAPPTK